MQEMLHMNSVEKKERVTNKRRKVLHEVLSIFSKKVLVS